MISVPRWGIHNQVKFSPRRSILKICPVCDGFFLQVSRGNKKYCDELCSIKAKKQQMKITNQRIIKNRDKAEHANYMRELYADGRLSKKTWTPGTDTTPSAPVMEDGSVDWDAYHKTLRGKLQKLK